MQTEVPVLPAVCSDGHKRSNRDPDQNTRSLGVDNINHTTCKGSAYLLSNRKQLHPLVGGPYRSSMRLYAASEPVRPANKTNVGQRIMSAKMLRMKQLQNQLSDAHYHLNELANENRLLKALQKRQDSALRRYEGTNAELPRIINSHHEELKALQTKYKKLRTQHKHTCDLMKEKENEIRTLQSQNKHLIQLSKDRHLEERDKLQIRVSDLNFRIQQQQETIQTLNRKLTLESKSLKHQLNAEVAKHKETQKHLHDTLNKLKNLEDLLDNREKRLYYSGRLPVFSKGKSVGSQSLMSLGNNGSPSNPLKSENKSRGSRNEGESGSLPKLTKAELTEGKTLKIKVDRGESSPVTETMSSLQQVRKFRLPKSYSGNSSAGRSQDRDKSEEDEAERKESRGTVKSSNFEKLKAKRAVMNEYESDDEDVKKFVENFEIANGKGPYKLPKQLMREFGYSSSESECEDGTKTTGGLEYDATALTNKSRDLHSRLISGNSTVLETISKKSSKKKNLINMTETDSESETQTKVVSVVKENYSVTVRSGAQSTEDNHSNPSVEEFLKLDINATDSDLEMERLRRASARQSDKSLGITVDNLIAGGYENSQQRLLNITKSWTDLQDKIRKDREYSEIQLKALTEGNSINDYLLENKLIDADSGDNAEKDTLISSMSGDTNEKCEESSAETNSKRNNSRTGSKDRDRLSVNTNMELHHEQQNGIMENSKDDENESSLKIETVDDDEHHEYDKESAGSKNSDKLTSKMFNSVNNQESEKISSDSVQQVSSEENGMRDEKEDNAATEIKVVNYNKQKLLAAMKAIDDNENIEFLSGQKHRGENNIIPIRSQSTVTENLYRGLPAHARKKEDLLKEIFGDGKTETKIRAGCSKLH